MSDIDEKIVDLKLRVNTLESDMEDREKRCDVHFDTTHKVKEAIYNPDTGIYARNKELEQRVKILEKWKEGRDKIIWVVGSSVVGLLIAKFWSIISLSLNA